jgi:hypothetical protein
MRAVRKTPYLIALLLVSESAWALNPHPRIWLTPSLLSTLTNKVTGHDSDWVALKANADRYKVYNVAPYNRSACPSQQICYTYEGNGWYDAMVTLALVYRVTGDTSYAAQAAALLDAMNAPYKNSHDLSPITLDSGYPTRFALAALAIGYDWLYDYINSTEKTDTINTINAAYSWFTGGSPPYANNGPAYNNYFGGHMLGFGLAADATDGDNSNSATIYTTIRSLFDLNMGYGLQPDPVTVFAYSGGYYTSGGFNGGGVPESYNYGPNHNVRLFELILAWKTSGRVNLTSNYAQWMKNSVNNLIHTLRPNLWQVGDEGDMPGSCTGVLNGSYPLLLAYLLDGTTEAAWSEFLFRSLTVNPCDSTLGPPAAYDAVLWKNTARTAADYTQTLATSYLSDGDGHLLARSGWGSSAVFLSFNGSGAYFTGHQNLAAGNIELQRGSDYLLVNAAQWKGTAGYGGNPEIFATAAQYASTLYFDDAGAYNYAGGNYAGGQMFWGATSLLASRIDSNVSYVLADLGTAYDKRPDSRVPANRTARYYYRAVAYLGGNAVFVWDRFRAKNSAYRKRLQWHLNPTNAPSVNGTIVSTSKGSSALFIDTLLPASPTITVARDTASDGTTPLTYNAQVSDSSSGTDLNALTIIYTTAFGGSLPATTSLGTVDANHVGVQVSDSTPLVVVFAKPVQDNGDNTYTPLTYTSTTFTTSHSGTGKYLVAGLQAGTYSVVQSGVALPGYSAVAVGADGTLFFNATSGSFSVFLSGTAISLCDLNADGVVNNSDVQIAISQALGSSACGNADLGRNGTCNVIDVQRVINAANGQTCKVGQ